MTDATNMNLRVIFAAKGVTMKNVAELTGYTHGHVRNVCCGLNKSKKAHREIEAILGMKPGSIWSDLSTEATANHKEDKQ